MAWDVEYTDEFEDWWNDLTIDDQDSVESCIPFLNRHGPSLGRPLVDTVRGSRHPHMKELRPPPTNIRILFAFDPRRISILLTPAHKPNPLQERHDQHLPISNCLHF